MDKTAYINLINSKLNEQGLLIIEEKAIAEWDAIERVFSDKIQQYEEVKYVILGEAPINAKNFVLDNSSPISARFLQPIDFGFETRIDLNDFMCKNGILPFDLYPLPLPTFLYDNITFKYRDSNAELQYHTFLKEYWSQLESKIQSQKKQPELIIRYAKLYKRIEWKLFTEKFASLFSNTSKPHDISKSYGADRNEIAKIFNIKIQE